MDRICGGHLSRTGRPFSEDLPLIVQLGSVAAFWTYASVLVIGAPIYFFLRSRGLTSFWLAPLVGFFVGGAVATAMVGAQLASIVGGPPGALVGTVLWLIGRPDRQAR
jgi:hypothetical protein